MPQTPPEEPLKVHIHRCFEHLGFYTCRCDRPVGEGMCDECFHRLKYETESDLARKRKLKEMMNLVYYQLLSTDMLAARARGDEKEEDHLLDMMDEAGAKLTGQQLAELDKWVADKNNDCSDLR